jgi:ubiquinol-cytochrome c reductase iron-sulfur subunit
VSEGEHRTAVTLTSARADDPQMQPLAKHPESAARWIGFCFIVGFLGMAGFGATYWVNAKPWTLGATLGAGLLFLGLGLAAWGKYLMPRGPFVEERHELASSDVERDALAATIVQRGGSVVKRRKVLGGLLGAGVGTFSLVALFPLLRSLGPLPKQTLDETNWKAGSYVVDIYGNRVTAGELSVGTIISAVFPEGFQNNDQAMSQDQSIVIRVSDTDFTTEPGRESWGPQGYLVYSKLCTHLGCPVGLYEKELHLLVCPCHQSMFNVLDGCVPEFGPAPRPLPQLAVYFDPTNGYLRAQAGYDQPVGPGFWERS